MSNTSSERPFFIVGCPRSGTTLLQLLVSSNSDISIPPESHIFERFSEIFGCYGNLEREGQLRMLVEDILNDEPIREWGLEIVPTEFCDRLEERSLRGVISLLFQLYAEREGKTRWADKTPQHCFYLEGIRRVFPDAKFIHLVRDGRDVAESLSRVYIGPKSIREIAERWKRYVLEFHRFKDSLNSDSYLEVHYEKLVSDPQKEIQRIYDFVGHNNCFKQQSGLNVDTDSLDFRSYPHHASLKAGVSQGKVAVFKEKFSQRQIQIFESIAGPALSLYGYPLVTNGKVTLSLMEKLNFAFEDNVYRYLRKLVNPLVWPLLWKQLVYGAQNVLRKVRMRRRSA